MSETLYDLVGRERIDRFAACTGDRQWLHLDAERAAKGPFGATIAHGYLTLSLLASTALEVFGDRFAFIEFLNYGLDRVRFIQPVRVDARVRNRIAVARVDSKGPGRTLVTTHNTLEIEGENQPALVATALGMAMH